jgi:hypothetical protein
MILDQISLADDGRTPRLDGIAAGARAGLPDLPALAAT